MIKANDLKQLPVLSIVQGRKISNVKDILYDPYENKVAALTLYWGDFLPQERYLLYEDIKSIGHDAIIIETPLAVKKPNEINKSILGLKKKQSLLLGTRIVTEVGNRLGKATDYFFDLATGIVTHLEVSQGPLDDIKSGRKVIPIDNIISMGPDATIVKVTTQEEIKRQKDYGGLQAKWNQVSEKISQMTTSVNAPTGNKSGEENTVATEANELAAQMEGYQHPYPHKEESEQVMEEDTNYHEAVEKLQALAQKTKQQVSILQNRAQEEVYKLKENPQLKEKYQNLKEKTREQAEQFQQVAYNQVTALKENRLEKRKQNVVGLFLTKTILAPDDTILAERGEIITHKLLEQAEKFGLIAQVLKNTSYNPII